jgi:hypothetical protein
MRPLQTSSFGATFLPDIEPVCGGIDQIHAWFTALPVCTVNSLFNSITQIRPPALPFHVPAAPA